MIPEEEESVNESSSESESESEPVSYFFDSQQLSISFTSKPFYQIDGLIFQSVQDIFEDLFTFLLGFSVTIIMTNESSKRANVAHDLMNSPSFFDMIIMTS